MGKKNKKSRNKKPSYSQQEKRREAELHNARYVEEQAYREDRIRDPKKYERITSKQAYLTLAVAEAWSQPRFRF
jgi:hypothetical protein